METARIQKPEFKHSFKKDDIIFKVDDDRIIRFIIIGVVSDSQVRGVMYKQNGELGDEVYSIKDERLKGFRKDILVMDLIDRLKSFNQKQVIPVNSEFNTNKKVA